MTYLAFEISPNSQSLSRILNFKPLFVTILSCFILFSVQPLRKVCVANRNIGQICLNIFYLTKNNTQTAVMNITDKRIVEKKKDLLLNVSYASTYIFRSNRLNGKTTKFKFEKQ